MQPYQRSKCASLTVSSVFRYLMKMTGLWLLCLCGVSVFAQAPVITNGPVDASRLQGDTQTFVVQGTYFAGSSWQWYFNGSPITSGIPTNTLSLTNIGVANAGQYYAVVSKTGFPSVTSDTATLTVTPVSGVFYDFNKPGEFTNNFNARGGKNVSDLTAYPGGAAVWGEAADGGVNNSRSLTAYATTNVSTLTAWRQPFNFSQFGNILNASVMFKYKDPTMQPSSNQLMYVGFLYGTNTGPQFTANTPTNTVFGYAINGPFYIGGRLYVVTNATSTNVNMTLEVKDSVQTKYVNGGTAPALTVGNWYRLSLTMMNKKVGTFRTNGVSTVLESLGPNGTDAPVTVMSFSTNNTMGSDILFTNRLYLGFSPVDYMGVDRIDNVAGWMGSGALAISTPPQAQTVLQNRSATLTVGVLGRPPYDFQWYKDGTSISGATNASYTIEHAAASDGGSYTVQVSGITSDAALLTVTPDTQAPTVVSVGSVDGKRVGVHFDEAVSAETAQAIGNYMINGSVAVTAATLLANGQDVDLTLATPVTGSFTVAVSGIADLAGNQMSSAATVSGNVMGLLAWDAPGEDGVVPASRGSFFSSKDGDLSIRASGDDLGGTADDGYLLMKQLRGDFDIKVQVQNVSRANLWNTNPGGDEFARVGLVARETTNANSRALQLVVYPSDFGLPAGKNASELSYRPSTGALMTNVFPNGTISSNGIAYPQWLRLRKVNTTLSSYRSLDGETWTMFANFMEPTLPVDMLVGVGASAHQEQPIGVDFRNYGTTELPGASITSVELQPATANIEVPASLSLTSMVAVSGISIKEVQYTWQRTNVAVENGWTNIPTASATSSNYVTPVFSMADERDFSSWAFRCIVQAGAISITTEVSRVTGFVDTNAATILNVQAPLGGISNIVVTLSRPVTPETLTNLSNYILTNSTGVVYPIIDVKILNNGPSNAVVMLIVGTDMPKDTYWLQLGGFVDYALPPNTSLWKTREVQAPAPAGIYVEIYKNLATPSNLSKDEPSNLISNTKFLNHTYDSAKMVSCSFVDEGNAFSDSGIFQSFYIVPPSNGQYKVWLACDDGGMVRMNTNGADPKGVVTIAYRSTWIGGGTAYSVNSSMSPTASDRNYVGIGGPIYLEAGKRYYTEVINKNNSGGDFGKAALRAYSDGTTPPEGESICYPIAQPASWGPVSVASVTPSSGSDAIPEDTIVTFTANGVQGFAPLSMRWFVNGVEQSVGVNQTNAAIRILAGDTNVTFVLSNAFSSASVSVPLTVALETNAPVALGGYGNGLSRFYITTSTRLEPSSVTNVANYSIPGVTVLSASVFNRTNIVLKTTPQVQGSTYSISIQNILGAGYLHLPMPSANILAKAQVVAPGVLLREYYTNIVGSSMSDLTNNAKYLAHMPDVIDSTDSARTPEPFGTNYGAVMSGYITVPVTTNYTFFMVNDDAGEFQLSTDEGIENLQFVDTNLTYRSNPDKNAGKVVRLTNGVLYYFQAKVKQAAGADALRISVRKPWESQALAVSTPLPSSMLLAGLDPDLAIIPQIGVTAQPTNTVAQENLPAAFYVSATNTGNWAMGYFWQKADTAHAGTWTNVPGAFGKEFYPVVTLADTGVQYRVGVSVPGRIVYSQPATVQVLRDMSAPGIASASGHALPNKLILTFTETVDPTSVTNNPRANFVLKSTGGIAGPNVTNATMVTPTVWLLTVDTNIVSDTYSLTVNNVKDIAQNSMENVISLPFSAPWITIGTNMQVNVWTNFGGSFASMMNKPTYPYQPDWATNLPSTQWEQTSYTNAVGGVWDNYGAQMRGVLIPPVSGNYAFYIYADDAARLSIGPGGTTTLSNVMINAEGSCAACNYAASYSTNTIYLLAGMPYNFENLFFDLTRDDYSRMQWMVPGEKDWKYISGANLYGFSINRDWAFLTNIVKPTNMTVFEGRDVTLYSEFSSGGAAPINYQWQRYNTSSGQWEDMVGETNTALKLGTVCTAMDQLSYRQRANMSAYNGLIVVTNYSGVMTNFVMPDNAAPYILSYGSLDGSRIGVVFSEPVLMDGDILNIYDWEIYDSNIVANLTDRNNKDTWLQWPVVGVEPYPDPTATKSEMVVLYLPEVTDWSSYNIDGWPMPFLHGDIDLTCWRFRDVACHYNERSSTGNIGGSTNMLGTVMGLSQINIWEPQPYTMAFVGSNNIYRVSSAGRDFYETGDQGVFIEKPITGDFDVRVQVNNIPIPPQVQPNEWSKAVLMARGNIIGTDGITTNSSLGKATNSLMTYIGTTATNAGSQRKIETLVRWEDLGFALDFSANYKPVRTYPTQLRMTREIMPVSAELVTNVIRTYYWDFAVTTNSSGVVTTNSVEEWLPHTVFYTTNWPETMYVGMGLTSHSISNPVSAIFQNFTVIDRPTIVTQPVGVTAAEGTIVALSVEATGPETGNPLVYQWRKDGVNIPGANSRTLTLASAVARDSGYYTVVVRNSAGAVTSSQVAVQVAGAPWVAVQPADQTTLCNGTATFTVTPGTSTPADPITYQWLLAGTNLPGATSQTLTVNNASPEIAGPYSVVVGNSLGYATSSNAFIILDDTVPPSITFPADMALECGTPAVFTVEARNSCGAVVPVTCTPPSGTVFPIGTNTVSCVAANPSGAATNCSFMVVMSDTIPPMITCPANITGTNTVVTWTAPTATDACKGPVPVVCMPPSGSTFALGVTTVTCEATDGFNANTCSFTVTVQPAVESPQLTITKQANGAIVSWPASAADFALFYDSSAHSWTLGPCHIETFAPGNYQILCPEGVTPPSWQPYLGTLTTNGNTISASVSFTNSTMFFRLVKP